MIISLEETHLIWRTMHFNIHMNMWVKIEKKWTYPLILDFKVLYVVFL